MSKLKNVYGFKILDISSVNDSNSRLSIEESYFIIFFDDTQILIYPLSEHLQKLYELIKDKSFREQYNIASKYVKDSDVLMMYDLDEDSWKNK